MQQVYQQQLLHQQQQYQQLQAMASAQKAGSTEATPTSTPQVPVSQQNGPIVPSTVNDTAIQNGEEQHGDEEGKQTYLGGITLQKSHSKSPQTQYLINLHAPYYARGI